MLHPNDALVTPAIEQLKAKIVSRLKTSGHLATAINGLMLTRKDEVYTSESCFHGPTVGIVVQGFKRSVIGNEEYRYGEKYCLVSGIDIPSISHITDASADKPFLAISLPIDRYLAAELATTIPLAHFANIKQSLKGISVDYVDVDVVDAFLRLTDLLDKPEQIPVMAPMIIREIHYRLLLGSQGECLRMICTHGTQSHHIANAITWLRNNYKQPLNIDELAQSAFMATSTFHRHFKQVTTLSPLQFQKRLRLYEAQRLMLTKDMDTTTAALSVGYESPTQFNREYKRLFGEPPRRDMQRLQLSDALVY